MADIKPPALPFFDDGESVERAAQQLLDHASQLKFVRRQNAQLAARQEAIYAEVGHLRNDVHRIANGQTVCTSLMDLLNRRLKKLMDKQGVEDVPDLDGVLEKL